MKTLSLFAFLLCFLNNSSATDVLDSLNKVVANCNSDSDCVNSRLELVRVLFQSGDPDKARQHAHEALNRSIRSEYVFGEIKSRLYLGNLLLAEAESDQAGREYAVAAALANRIKDKPFLRLAMLNLGNVEMQRANYPSALKYYFASLKLAESLRDSSALGDLYNSIGNVYDHWSDYPNAQSYYHDALEIKLRIGDTLSAATLYNNLAGIRYVTGDTSGAIQFHKQAIEIELRYDDQIGLSYSYNNLGEIYIGTRDYSQAEKYITEALTIRENFDDKEGVISCLINLSRLNTSNAEYNKALSLLSRAEQIARGSGLSLSLQDVFEQLSETYERRAENPGGADRAADLALSLSYRKQFSAIKDSLFNSEYNRKIAEVQGLYETEKKQRQISDLQKKTALQQAEYNRQKIINYAVAGGFLLIASFSIALYNRFKLTRSQKDIIENQKRLVEEKNKDITDSINYSRRIQQAILVPSALIKNLLPGCIVLYRPKDIVSGDFYYVEEKGEKVVVAVADCTGHGVPGAFMSLIGNNILDKLIKEQGITEPSVILEKLHEGVKDSLHQESNESDSKDGMDIALCCFNRMTMELDYAGAMRNLYVVDAKGGLKEIKADKQSIGGRGEDRKSFSGHRIRLERGDSFYMFSDGYADQFGGPEGKKFMTRRLKDLLVEVNSLEINTRLGLLEQRLNEWKGDLEQVDDVCVVGVQV